MKNLKCFALVSLLVAMVVMTPGCSSSQTCNVCDPQGRVGLTVSVVDADGVVHSYTTGDNGCASFQADDCSKFQAVDVAMPESPPVN